jgi:hypothetical protein
MNPPYLDPNDYPLTTEWYENQPPKCGHYEEDEYGRFWVNDDPEDADCGFYSEPSNQWRQVP